MSIFYVCCLILLWSSFWRIALERGYINKFTYVPTYLFQAGRSHNDKLHNRFQNITECREHFTCVLQIEPNKVIFWFHWRSLWHVSLIWFIWSWNIDFEGGNSDMSFISAKFECFSCPLNVHSSQRRQQPILNPFVYKRYLERTFTSSYKYLLLH